MRIELKTMGVSLYKEPVNFFPFSETFQEGETEVNKLILWRKFQGSSIFRMIFVTLAASNQINSQTQEQKIKTRKIHRT